MARFTGVNGYLFHPTCRGYFTLCITGFWPTLKESLKGAMDVAVPAQNFLRCTFSINRIALSIVGAWFLPFEILHVFYRLTKVNKSSNFNFNPVLFKNIPTFHLQVLQGTSPLQHHKNRLDQTIISNPPASVMA